MEEGTVVIPTLNEEEYIGTVVEQLKLMNLEVIVVDANSPDETRKKASEKGAKVINKKTENDLANSVLTGIRNSSNEKVIVMDGDGQHPVEPVKKFLELLDENSLVIGYRETVEDDWPIHRRAISIGAELIARSFLRECREVNDPLSGFFGVRKSDFDLEKFKPRGYKIIIEFLMKNKGSKAEVGYSFKDRKGGSSSIGIKEILEYQIQILELKYQSLKYI